MKITGTKLFLKALKTEGVDTLFAYPGANNIDLLDGLYKQKDLDVILPRHEQALIHAAEGYARSTGKVGVCLVTSGPGATNLVTGIADAYYDSIPLVCFTGQVPIRLIGNDAFQEVDIVGITRSITKYSVMVTERKDLARIIKEAFYIATTGKPGPVLVDLPSDMMKEIEEETYPKSVNIRSYKPNESVHIGQLKRAMTLLKNAERPVFLIGGGVNISAASDELTALAEKTRIPVITTIMGKGAIDTKHELYIGNIGMHGAFACNKAVMECDVLFSIGTRFNDRITGEVKNFAPKAKIVHIDIDTASISRNVKVDIPIVADAKLAIEKMIELSEEQDRKEWLDKIKGWAQEHPMEMSEKEGLIPENIIKIINEKFDKVVVVTDVGQHQMWTSQFIELNKNKKLITSGGLGTMGFGFPAAIGAQIGNPDKKVVCISGDGGIQMNIQEMATAVAQELPLIIIIINNNYLGMVRQHQQLFYDRRYSLTCLRHRKSCAKKCGIAGEGCPKYAPDFVMLAESYGAKGFRATNQEEFKKALDFGAESKDIPTVIECMIDPEEIVMPMVKAGNTLDNMIMQEV